MKVLELLRLTKWYGKTRGAEDISFSLEPGEVFGYLGPNGSGKTTTLRCLMGFLRPTSGEARLFGNVVRPGKAIGHERIGFLPGDFRPWPGLRGEKVLELLANIGSRGKANPERRRELAEMFELNLTRPVRQLSKGNRQKLGLVLAFQSDPDLLILDEPTASLDPIHRQNTLDLIRAAARRGAAVLLSSHDLAQVASVCDRAAILREGKLVELATLSALLKAREHWIKAWFSEGIPDFPVERFKNARVLAASDRFLHLAYHGAPAELLRWLAPLPVERFESPEPTLEEAFLQYYRPAAGADGKESDA